jgi:hypothetical protein
MHEGAGGVKRKHKLLAGFTVLFVVQEAVFVPPAVVADQFVVVVRLLKSVFAEPRRPTWQVRAVVLVMVKLV